ncbi:MAG: glycosyltransferase family 4 protein [Acidobacteriota bacterium]|nr:glycosyltransferase family 4 protein [Acidobacteriota bacterium]
MLKVLHTLDSLGRGGAEMQALDVCRNANKHGLDLTFVATGGGALEEDFRQSGAEFIRLNRRLPVDFNVVLQLRKIIKQREIQIVQGYQPVEGLHLYLASIGLPVKRVLSFQGFIYDKKNQRTARFLIPQMHANIVVSRGLQNWLEAVDKLNVQQNFHVVYNGADRERILSNRKILREELNLLGDDLLIGMIANFYRDPRKDQMTICRALPKVFAEIKNAHCVFVGKTETGAEEKFEECVRFCAENGIADRVHFLGGRDDVPDVLASLDLFVFSSLQEGLPVAVTEAMLAKVPMIVSDIEPLLEVSDNGKYAEVFQTQNALELTEKILKLLTDVNLREDLANRAYDFARENFSIEAHLKNLKNLYESLLKK